MTHPEFGAHTTATEVATTFRTRIQGRTFVVTGLSPNSLGEAIALALASQQPAHLILASLPGATKLSAAAARVHDHYPRVRISTVPLDLSSFACVRAAAAEITRLLEGKRGSIAALFNNAGVLIGERSETANGIELQFGTNHVGPFLLTNLLMPLLLRDGGKGDADRDPEWQTARVVMTSSEGHRVSPIRFTDYNFIPGASVPPDELPRPGLREGMLRNDGGYEPAIAYGQSKTANVLLAVGLNARLGKARGVESFAAMPGTVRTGFASDVSDSIITGMTSWSRFWKSPDQGAATMLVAALDPKLSVEKEVYLDNCQVKKPARWASDVDKADRLWRLTEELVEEKFNYSKESRL